MHELLPSLDAVGQSFGILLHKTEETQIIARMLTFVSSEYPFCRLSLLSFDLGWWFLGSKERHLICEEPLVFAPFDPFWAWFSPFFP